MYCNLFQINDGFLQFRFNLGSGEITARQTTIQVNDGKTHTVSVKRKERMATLVIDDSYVARATSPGGSNTLDITNDRVYLGASVSADGKASSGFSGCITGARLNYRDLPVSGSTKDFVANPSSGVESGCTFEPPQTGGAFPTVVGIAAGGVGFFIIFIALPIGIIICIVGRYGYRRRKKRGEYSPRTEHATTRSPTFNWQPVQGMQNTGDSRHRLMLTQSSTSDSFALQDLNQSRNEGLLAPSTPATSEHIFRTPDQTPEQPTHREHQQRPMDERLEQEHQQQHTPQSNRHVRRLQLLEQQQQQQQQEEEEEEQQAPRQQRQQSQQIKDNAIAVPPPVAPKPQTQLSNDSSSASASASQAPAPPTHTRSSSGHQSIMTIMTTATERSEATSIFDDTEVGKYVLKRIEAANEEMESLQIDETMTFKEEGDFEPLGSIGSLYDILREADENLGPLEYTSAPASRPPLKPKPAFSNLPTHPINPQAPTPPSDAQSTKYSKLEPRHTKVESRQCEQPNHNLPSKEEMLSSLNHNHTRSNGMPPQPAEVVSKPRGRRRGRHAAAPARILGAERA